MLSKIHTQGWHYVGFVWFSVKKKSKAGKMMGLLTAILQDFCIRGATLTISYTLCNSAIQTHTHKHTHTKSKGEGIFKSTLGAVLDVAGNILPLRLWVFFFYPFLSYLPVLVRTIMALAEHLKEDSTAPTATASEGSLVSWECLLSSSNSCLWKVAASASRAIWAPNDHEGRVGGYSQSHTTTTAHQVIHTPGSAWKTLS